jgi:hypothetical protein
MQCESVGSSDTPLYALAHDLSRGRKTIHSPRLGKEFYSNPLFLAQCESSLDITPQGAAKTSLQARFGTNATTQLNHPQQVFNSTRLDERWITRL